MGEIRASVKIENSNDRALYESGKIPKKKIRTRDVEAVVDTGAVMTLLPEDLVKILGLSPMEPTIVQLANDQKVEMGRAGPLTLTVAGRTTHIDCLVGPPGCEMLIGQLVMEGLDLICDPGKRTLTVRPESPFRPTLKLKAIAREAVPA
jgi:hypothetical protein